MASIKQVPAKLDITIKRGDDLAHEAVIKEGGPPAVAVDVSARTYTAQVRSTPDGTVVASMTIDMTQAASGIVVYSLLNTVTDDLDGAYVWDFQQSTAGVIRTLFGGSFVVIKDVTRVS